MNKKSKKAIFLDRDGTINREINYLYKPSQFKFIPKAVEAIKIFHDLGYLVIVITNQSGVARGYYTEDDINILHRYIDRELKKIAIQNIICDIEEENLWVQKKGYYIDAYYYCPHHPNGVINKYTCMCNCRKPKTGMIHKAIKEFKGRGINIDLSKSFMVGDKESDILTGKNAGIYKTVLVRSGHKVDEYNTIADIICDDLFEFAKILKNNYK